MVPRIKPPVVLVASRFPWAERCVFLVFFYRAVTDSSHSGNWNCSETKTVSDWLNGLSLRRPLLVAGQELGGSLKYIYSLHSQTNSTFIQLSKKQWFCKFAYHVSGCAKMGHHGKKERRKTFKATLPTFSSITWSQRFFVVVVKLSSVWLHKVPKDLGFHCHCEVS